jgi:nucleoside-diphosphate-sugar epimerase
VILATGATGFVGRALIARLLADGESVRAAVRGHPDSAPLPVAQVVVGDLGAETDWRPALRGIETVVHCAARVHVMRETASDPLADFRRVNVAGTLALARQAAAAGVRRFVFLSSIKVNGEATPPGQPFTALDAPAPVDPYGISKREAEDGLMALSRETGLEIAIIRPVLVYGPGVKGNFRSLIRWLDRGVPLPLGGIHNKRSLVALDNLVDLIATCVRHPAAAGGTFLVSDDEDMSTSELLRRTAAALGRRPRMVAVPAGLLRVAATTVGRGEMVQRLVGSLQVDITATRRTLGWAPVVSVDEALRRTVRSV